MSNGRFDSNEKVMYIMRGLPGSGKSTKAKSLKGETGVIYSTDDFFMVDGVYVFDGKKIASNHNMNQRRVEKACSEGVSPIIVDNTNTQRFEAKPYVQLAKRFGYTVKFVEADTPWARDVDELTRRNTHGVPREGIARMLARYEDNFTEDTVLASKAPWEK